MYKTLLYALRRIKEIIHCPELINIQATILVRFEIEPIKGETRTYNNSIPGRSERVVSQLNYAKWTAR